jgi:hypothetical protein
MPAEARHQEWLTFLRMIDQTLPADKEIYLICDNYSTHKHERVERWLGSHKRFHVLTRQRTEESSIHIACLDEFVIKRTKPKARENMSLADVSCHFLRRKNHNATEPAEILDIECQQILDFMHVHRCYQASIVDLNAGRLEKREL